MLCELFYGIAVWSKIRMLGMSTSSISTSTGLPQRHLSITGSIVVVVVIIIICGSFSCTHVCVPHASLVPTEDGKGLCIPWNWSYRWWRATTRVLGSESCPLGKKVSALDHWSISASWHLWLYFQQTVKAIGPVEFSTMPALFHGVAQWHWPHRERSDN